MEGAFMNRTVVISLVVLVAVVGAFAYLNAGDREDRLLSQRESRIFIAVDGDRIETVDFDTIRELEEHRFTATLRSSDGSVRDHTYAGVLVKDLLEHYEMALADARQVVATAADGYAVALTVEEVLEDDNVYIAYMIDGEPMASREDGGSGPYQLIIRRDEFGQRWNKYLMEIDIR